MRLPLCFGRESLAPCNPLLCVTVCCDKLILVEGKVNGKAIAGVLATGHSICINADSVDVKGTRLRCRV